MRANITIFSAQCNTIHQSARNRAPFGSRKLDKRKRDGLYYLPRSRSTCACSLAIMHFNPGKLIS